MALTETDQRPIDPSDYRELGRYVAFAEAVEVAYAATGRLPYLNALLKCMDTLCALRHRLDPPERMRLDELIAGEAAHVAALEEATA